MAPPLEFGLIALGLLVMAWLSRKLGLSSIVGFIVLGLLLGPHGVLPLYDVSAVIELFGELGLILLLFYLGLEFSLRRFLEGRRVNTVAGTIDLLNFGAGVAVGFLVGFPWLPALFLGGIVYISSSGVIARLLAEWDLAAYPEAERTLGVLVFEDLAMVLILGGLGFLTIGTTPLKLLGVLGFLLAFVLVARFGRQAIARLLDQEGEVFVLLILALVVLVSLGGKALGFPEAIAAFLLGMLVAESGFKDRIEAALQPFYVVAAGAFFLSFGLNANLGTALGQLPLALVLVVVTFVVNTLSGFLAGRASGLSVRASVGHGLMLVPRGEFSLVIAGMAAAAPQLSEEVRATLVAVTSLYVLIMVILGSLIYRYYDRLTTVVAERLRRRRVDHADAEREAELESVTLD